MKVGTEQSKTRVASLEASPKVASLEASPIMPLVNDCLSATLINKTIRN